MYWYISDACFFFFFFFCLNLVFGVRTVDTTPLQYHLAASIWGWTQRGQKQQHEKLVRLLFVQEDIGAARKSKKGCMLQFSECPLPNNRNFKIITNHYNVILGLHKRKCLSQIKSRFTSNQNELKFIWSPNSLTLFTSADFPVRPVGTSGLTSVRPSSGETSNHLASVFQNSLQLG